MVASYNKLWKLFIDRKMKKKDLQKLVAGSASLITELSRDESVTTVALMKIYAALKCDIGNIHGSCIWRLERTGITQRSHSMKVISLFSGAGGLDLGLIQAGNQVVWANDIDCDAVATYIRNIGDHIICADIKDVDIGTLPDDADVVVGGFPCQGFSQANLRRTVDDERNLLYKFFYKVIQEKQPKFFIAENVKGLLSIGRGEVIERIAADFRNAGYITAINLVHMADYGIPQTRQRIIIIGQRRDLGDEILFRFPNKTNGRDGNPHPWVSIESVLRHYPEPEESNDYLNHICSAYKVEYRNFTGHRATDPSKPSPTILARGNGKGGVCAIPHYNGKRRLTIRESATVQTFPESFEFIGQMNSCYRQIGNAVPVKFAYMLGQELIRLEGELA